MVLCRDTWIYCRMPGNCNVGGKNKETWQSVLTLMHVFCSFTVWSLNPNTYSAKSLRQICLS